MRVRAHLRQRPFFRLWFRWAFSLRLAHLRQQGRAVSRRGVGIVKRSHYGPARHALLASAALAFLAAGQLPPRPRRLATFSFLARRAVSSSTNTAAIIFKHANPAGMLSLRAIFPAELGLSMWTLLGVGPDDNALSAPTRP